MRENPLYHSNTSPFSKTQNRKREMDNPFLYGPTLTLMVTVTIKLTLTSIFSNPNLTLALTLALHYERGGEGTQKFQSYSCMPFGVKAYHSNRECYAGLIQSDDQP